jgi:hypothetical protein
MRHIDIFLAILAALSQFGNAFMGWKVTGKQLSARKQKIYDGLFISLGMIGIISVGVLAAHSGRQERAHFSQRITNTFESYDSQTKRLIPFSWYVVDKPLKFNVYIKNVGSGSAYNAEMNVRSFIEPDLSLTSQHEAISEFQTWLALQPHHSITWPKDFEMFNTAAGAVLSPEDYSNLTTDRRTVFVIGKVTFDDDFGSHEFDVCQMMQPQEKYSAGAPTISLVHEIWGTCDSFSGEK